MGPSETRKGYCSVHHDPQSWLGEVVVARAAGAERRSALGAAALLPYKLHPVIQDGLSTTSS
jgi:hypothetical protein